MPHRSLDVRERTTQGARNRGEIELSGEVKVPMYVNVGDILQIDTRDGRFVKRM